MADFLAPQPVVQMNDSGTEFGLTTANPLIARLSDGTDLANIDASGNLNVVLATNSGVDIGDVDVTSVLPGTGATNLGKAEDSPHSTGDVGVMFLAVRQDAQAGLAADGDYLPPTIDANGGMRVSIVAGSAGGPNKVDDSAFAIGTDSVAPAGFLADETAPDSVDEGDVGLARMTLDRKQLMVMVDPTTDANRWSIDGSGHGQMDLAAVSVTAVPISKDGAANSETNPIFVQMGVGISGSEIHDYNTAASIAKDATSNHDYTVANTTFLLKSVLLSASGAMKGEIQSGPVASLTTKAVAFTSAANPFVQLTFDPPLEVPVTSTGTVRIIRTNRDKTQDLYSTIMGNDI